MKGFAWLAGFAGALVWVQTTWATAVPYNVQSSRGLANATVGRGAAATSRTASPATSSGVSSSSTSTGSTASSGSSGSSSTLLSSLVGNSSGVQSTVLSTRDGFVPETLGRGSRGRPSAPPPPPPPTTSTGSKPKSNSVPDGAATAALLGMGFCGTVLLRRKFAQ